MNALPLSWRAALADEGRQPYFKDLQAFLAEERRQHSVYPPEEDLFNALKLTALPDVKVVLIGQDPYHDEGQAHGLCFSVRPGLTPPPSLRNILKEMHADVGCPMPNNGCLEPWARQGVLLLNSVLTVRAHEPNSHKGKGWEPFTDAVLRAVVAREEPVVFVLWGAPAQKKAALVDAERHDVVSSAHPSPLAAQRGFFGSRPFSKANAALRRHNLSEIDWCLPDR
jgi:uracil-DNA glycosylase